jgi:hypothetical protein
VYPRVIMHARHFMRANLGVERLRSVEPGEGARLGNVQEMGSISENLSRSSKMWRKQAAAEHDKREGKTRFHFKVVLHQS